MPRLPTTWGLSCANTLNHTTKHITSYASTLYIHTKFYTIYVMVSHIVFSRGDTCSNVEDNIIESDNYKLRI